MSEQEEKPEYIETPPDIPGWYDVLIDGREERMVFRFCGTCGLFVWQDIYGNRADKGARVLWCKGSWDIRP